MKAVLKNLRSELFSWLVFFLFKIISYSWKIEEEDFPEEIKQRLQLNEHVVFAHFHEDEWALLGAYANRKMTVLVSLSSDGALMSGFLRKLGFLVHRGSSSRGGARGFISILRSLKSGGGKLAFAVDGPRGPRRKPKKGVLKAAQMLKAPILPAAVYVDKAWIFKKSWSKGFLPKPFAKIRICYSEPIDFALVTNFIEQDKDQEAFDLLESKLLDAKRLAKKKIRDKV